MMSCSTVVSPRTCHRYLRVELRHVSRVERVDQGRGELLRRSRRPAGRQNQGPPDAQHPGQCHRLTDVVSL